MHQITILITLILTAALQASTFPSSNGVLFLAPRSFCETAISTPEKPTMRRLVEVRQRFLRRWSRRKLASHRLRYTALLLLALSALLVLATILCFIQWVMLVLDVTDGWAALVLCITLIIDFIALSGVMLRKILL
ncbi:hypothetical protein C2E23DRAFT_513602 [Lenzites betulinus]|nr:hypothetical protein C2E23DRAFT_513602 [Lenzites betulinus]